ncbi:MAG TPA: hypothetical protein VF940_00735 [Streptosporangiaceae bacterium]
MRWELRWSFAAHLNSTGQRLASFLQQPGGSRLAGQDVGKLDARVMPS